MNRVLGFVGWPCAGKDVAAEYLVARHAAVWWGHYDFIRTLAREHGISSPTFADLSALFEARASHAGHGWIARIVAGRVRVIPMVVVTGVRNLAEVEIYRELPGFRLVKLQADRDLRFQRWCDHPRESDGSRTWEQFDAIEALDGNRNVPDVLALADRVVENNGSLEDFHRALDALLTA